MKVEELLQFGKVLEIPGRVLKNQKKVIFNMLRKEFGIPGFILLSICLRKHTVRIKNEFPYKIIRLKTRTDMEKQMVRMGALFFAITDKKGRNFAIKFMGRLMQNLAPVLMPAIYQLDKLIKCEGDVFENYKKFNRALFTKANRLGTWKNKGFYQTENLLEFKITACIIIDFFDAIGCFEVGKMCCDFHLTGYPLIEDATQSEFQLLSTLGKGGDSCHFCFYKKGTAPKKH